jgi:mycofactocin precursor
MTVSTEDTPTATTVKRSGDADRPAVEAPAQLVEEDLLVEDVSIDGMCGVY